MRPIGTVGRRRAAAIAAVCLVVLVGAGRLGRGQGGDVEQREPGTAPAARLVSSFDGLGVGFEGPQGTGHADNPSDNSLAVGPDHIVQIVNRLGMAVYTKRGERYDTTGRVLYGPVPVNNVFKGFGGDCDERNSGDAVVRYDQLAGRWLIVMPMFSRNPYRPDQPEPFSPADGARESVIGVPGQPGGPAILYQPPPRPRDSVDVARPPAGRPRAAADTPQGVWAMCYAISVGPDPLGGYYRYEFLRPFFPDFPRPAVWPDGYYVPTSTGDDPISESIATQRHACVVDRRAMLRGEPATEQCILLNNVNFLNNADIDGQGLSPEGAPNLMMANRGSRVGGVFEDSVIDVWRYHVDWTDPSKTRLMGPTAVAVAPYRFLCEGGRFCVPQRGTDHVLGQPGDKIMQRLVYRRFADHTSILAVQSVHTAEGGGGIRWYELRVDERTGAVSLYQQGTYLGDGAYRWLPSGTIDRFGNIGIGYSFGGARYFPGQRFTGREPGDPLGKLTFEETVLAEGEAPQTTTSRWEDYTTAALDPTDDCTVWYVGDYLKKGQSRYSTRIGAFRMPGCGP